MAGRTSVCSRNNIKNINIKFPLRKRRAGFTLIEILIVIVIMAMLVGVLGSLLSSYFRFSDMAVDMSIAQRRAQDVYNILELPVLDAGVGVPACSFDHYFSVDGLAPPVAHWNAPLSIISNDRHANRGNVLRVVYSVPLGTKNDMNEVLAFSAQGGVDLVNTYPGTINLTAGISFDNGPRSILPQQANTRSYITFPGAHMHPLLVLNSSTPTSLNLKGKKPHKSVPSEDIFVRNAIHPFQDVRLLRGAVAYVDRNSVFHLIDVFDRDPSNMTPASQNLPSVTPVSLDWSGFHVEGIRAVRFEQDADRRFLTVHILAEGDTADSSRNPDSAVFKEILDIWSRDITSLDRNLHYETFSKTWRTRSVQINED